MTADSGQQLQVLKVDGGASHNGFLMQFQADLLGVQVQRPTVSEITALGADYMAGLAVGFWQDTKEIRNKWKVDQTFQPAMSQQERERKHSGWLRAVEKSKA